MSHTTRLAGRLLGLALLLGAFGCSPSDCEKVRTWRNVSSSPCNECSQANCTMQVQEFSGAFSSPECMSDSQCAQRCVGDGGSMMGGNPFANIDCACVSNCLRTQRCRSAWDNVFSCVVRSCEMQCR